MNRNRIFNRLSIILPVASTVTAVIVVICDVVSIGLNPDYNPMRQSISDLVHYSWGWLEKIGIAFTGSVQALIALTILSSTSSRNNVFLRLAGWMYAVISFGFVLIIGFNNEYGLSAVSTSSRIHVAATLAVSIMFPIACLTLIGALRRNARAGVVSNYSIILAVISLAIAWQVLPFQDRPLLGLSERLLAGVNLAWIVFAGSNLPALVETRTDLH